MGDIACAFLEGVDSVHMENMKPYILSLQGKSLPFHYYKPLSDATVDAGLTYAADKIFA